METKNLIIFLLFGVLFIGVIFSSGCTNTLKGLQKDLNGVDDKTTDEDSQVEEEKHTICDDGECIEVIGSDKDECTEHSDCNHRECINKICKGIKEPGEDECSTSSNCFYYGCTSLGTCIKIAGDSEDECSVETEEDCIWCEDSDGGLNYDVKGTCEDYTGKSVQDECFIGAGGSARTRIREWQCIDNVCAIGDSDTTFCPFGECIDGTCPQ